MGSQVHRGTLSVRDDWPSFHDISPRPFRPAKAHRRANGGLIRHKTVAMRQGFVTSKENFVPEGHGNGDLRLAAVHFCSGPCAVLTTGLDRRGVSGPRRVVSHDYYDHAHFFFSPCASQSRGA